MGTLPPLTKAAPLSAHTFYATYTHVRPSEQTSRTVCTQTCKTAKASLPSHTGALPPPACLRMPPQLQTLVMPTLSCEHIQPLLDSLPRLRTLVISHLLMDVALPGAAEQIAALLPRLLMIMPETTSEAEAPFTAPHLYCTLAGGGTQQRPAPSTAVVRHLRDASAPRMRVKGLGLCHMLLSDRSQAAAVMGCFGVRSCLSVIGCTLSGDALVELATHDPHLQQLWVSSDVSSVCVIEACKAAQLAREGRGGASSSPRGELDVVLNTMVKGYSQSQDVYLDWLEVPRMFERWLVGAGKEGRRKVNVRVRDEESWVIY